MTPDKIRNLAIECGADVRHYPLSDDEIQYVYVLDSDELAAYTAAVEAPLHARIAQLEEALTLANEYMPTYGRNEELNKDIIFVNKALEQSSSTWLLEHDKEVEARILAEANKVTCNHWDCNSNFNVALMIEARNRELK